MHSPNCEYEICREDWPAAHSMCTDWFGVDEQGHIAVFFSSDSGAIPPGALRHPDDYPDPVNNVKWNALHDWLKSRKVHSEAVIDGNIIVDQYKDHSQHHTRLAIEKRKDSDKLNSDKINQTSTIKGRYFMALDDKCPRLDDLAIEPCRYVASVGKTVVDIDGVTIEQLRAWHEMGLCLACKFVLEEEFFYPGHGIFTYGHPDTCTVSPYARLFLPSAPISVYDVPEELIDILFMALFVDVRFGDASLIQPAEHGEVVSWGGGSCYLASDMKTIRPVDGEEEYYAEFFDEVVRLNGDWPHYQITPPQVKGSSDTDKEADAEE